VVAGSPKAQSPKPKAQSPNEEGSLYPALQRLLVNGWVSAEWGTTGGNRRARYYEITAAGRKQLEAEEQQYLRIAGAIARVLQAV
jgi:PadR family transcriptional regulator